MSDQPYFPESENEIARLEIKTERQAVIDQARWAGLRPGMRVLDVGCGPGLTTSILAELAQPGGSAVGIDRSEERIAHARSQYAADNIEFVRRNFFDDLTNLGEFDFVWMRFIHEYFLKEAFELTRHIADSVKPGGVLCLIDLDRNCLNHYGHSERLGKSIDELIWKLAENNNFDPMAGIKLHGHLYDLNFADIRVDIRAHHLIHGGLPERDRINFWQKIEVIALQSKYEFEHYEDGHAGFNAEFKDFFSSHKRFWYTPLIICSGIKPIIAQ